MIDVRHIRHIAVMTTFLALAALAVAAMAIQDTFHYKAIAVAAVGEAQVSLGLANDYRDALAVARNRADQMDQLRERRIVVLAAAITARNAELGPGFTQALAAAFYTAGEQHGVSPRLLASVCEVESAMDPAALSGAGAVGLCQVMPLWLPRLELVHSAADLYHWWFNIQSAAMILRHYQVVCGGTWQRAVSCYHGGPAALASPKRSTVQYLIKVTKRWDAFRRM